MALPPTVDLQTANRVLSIERSTGYGLAKRGEYPCKVLKLGNAYRVVTADLQRLVALDDTVKQPVRVMPPQGRRNAAAPQEVVARRCCCHCRCCSQ
ncbi:integrase [Streptomyces sp. SID2119]|uniref:integrase n=1 Tax=Streptomyces sp. SID2119 TaxID=2690253 RepID=UPI0031F5FD08